VRRLILFTLCFICPFALLFAACDNSAQPSNNDPPSDSNDIIPSVTPSTEPSAHPQLSFEKIEKIVLLWSARSPPKSREDDEIDPEHWLTKTVFFQNGRVDYTESTHYGIVLHSDSWQVDAAAFAELVGIFNEQGFFSLPGTFVYGPYDAAGYTLSVHIDGAIISSGYGPSFDPTEDEDAYKIHDVCCDAFKDMAGLG
jgi:hypothetical protein